ncbi:hypothetical protein [Akkermansia muciniphila]|jgi:hypothetical protein|uniref:hypothetical protein n=2 Tax=Akkermansia muciniphila TaxID=239935 RepID=UPI000FFF2BA3|nr:hypothetical protein [Akkermansia muciniphila]
MIQYLIIMKYSIILTFASSLLIYDSTCYGDACQINGLSQEELKNLSYDPPRNKLLSEAQDKKAWQTFVETYEIPVGKVQNWYNSIVDKNSADAAAKSFSTEVSPILKKLTGPAADMKKQVLSIPASPEMQKFILLRILQLQSRLLVIFLPMQSEREMDDNTCYRGSDLLFDTILEPTAQSAQDVAKFIDSRNESQEHIEASFKEPWSTSAE